MIDIKSINIFSYLKEPLEGILLVVLEHHLCDFKG